MADREDLTQKLQEDAASIGAGSNLAVLNVMNSIVNPGAPPLSEITVEDIATLRQQIQEYKATSEGYPKLQALVDGDFDNEILGLNVVKQALITGGGLLGGDALWNPEDVNGSIAKIMAAADPKDSQGYYALQVPVQQKISENMALFGRSDEYLDNLSAVLFPEAAQTAPEQTQDAEGATVGQTPAPQPPAADRDILPSATDMGVPASPGLAGYTNNNGPSLGAGFNPASGASTSTQGTNTGREVNYNENTLSGAANHVDAMLLDFANYANAEIDSRLAGLSGGSDEGSAALSGVMGLLGKAVADRNRVEMPGLVGDGRFDEHSIRSLQTALPAMAKELGIEGSWEYTPELGERIVEAWPRYIQNGGINERIAELQQEIDVYTGHVGTLETKRNESGLDEAERTQLNGYKSHLSEVRGEQTNLNRLALFDVNKFVTALNTLDAGRGREDPENVRGDIDLHTYLVQRQASPLDGIFGMLQNSDIGRMLLGFLDTLMGGQLSSLLGQDIPKPSTAIVESAIEIVGLEKIKAAVTQGVEAFADPEDLEDLHAAIDEAFEAAQQATTPEEAAQILSEQPLDKVDNKQRLGILAEAFGLAGSGDTTADPEVADTARLFAQNFSTLAEERQAAAANSPAPVATPTGSEPS